MFVPSISKTLEKADLPGYKGLIPVKERGDDWSEGKVYVTNNLPYELQANDVLVSSDEKGKRLSGYVSKGSTCHVRMSSWKKIFPKYDSAGKRMVGSTKREKNGEFWMRIEQPGGWFEKTGLHYWPLKRASYGFDFFMQVKKEGKRIDLIMDQFSEEEKKKRAATYEKVLAAVKKCKRHVNLPHRTTKDREDLKKKDEDLDQGIWGGRVSVHNSMESKKLTIKMEFYLMKFGMLSEIRPSGFVSSFVGGDKTFILERPSFPSIKYIILTVIDDKEPWNKSAKVLLIIDGFSRSKVFPLLAKKKPVFIMTDVSVFPSEVFKKRYGLVTDFAAVEKGEGYRKLDLEIYRFESETKYI